VYKKTSQRKGKVEIATQVYSSI